MIAVQFAHKGGDEMGEQEKDATEEGVPPGATDEELADAAGEPEDTSDEQTPEEGAAEETEETHGAP